MIAIMKLAIIDLSNHNVITKSHPLQDVDHLMINLKPWKNFDAPIISIVIFSIRKPRYGTEFSKIHRSGIIMSH